MHSAHNGDYLSSSLSMPKLFIRGGGIGRH